MLDAVKLTSAFGPFPLNSNSHESTELWGSTHPSKHHYQLDHRSILCVMHCARFRWLAIQSYHIRYKQHCVKSVQIRSLFWSVFSRIRTEYGEILRTSPYSVRMRENTDQKLLRVWTLFTQCKKCKVLLYLVMVLVLYLLLFHSRGGKTQALKIKIPLNSLLFNLMERIRIS